MFALLPCLLAPLAGCGGETPRAAADPPAAEVGLGTPVTVQPAIAEFYKERGHRPLWARGSRLGREAAALVGMLRAAETHGLDPAKYGLADVEGAMAAAAGGERRAVARAELLLSRAFAEFARDVRRVPKAAQLYYVDEELAPAQPSVREVMDAAAAAPSLGEHLAAVERVNPVYNALREALNGHRARTGAAHPEERLILANMARVRVLPEGGRFVLVDTAGSRLWMFEDGRIAGRMRAVVGKDAMKTPAMAGFIRYATLNPYWNLPPDLARVRARRVVKEGPGVLARERLQVLSDWSDAARPVGPGAIDWRAVAAGKTDVRMRQLPGGANVMGKVKFMLPNRLGIYLHDTPDKSLFGRADRRLSSGCVRVADAERLSRWLFAGREVKPRGSAPEQRVDLPEPVPVFITQLTALPGPDGIVIQKDGYGRDAPLLAELAAKASRKL
jgi:murein L,D-transpeptidase YcbB/YkuD